MSVLTIAGSPAPASRSAALLEFVARRLQASGVERQHLSVRALPAEDLLHAVSSSAPLQRAIKTVQAARAVVVATPIYKASFSGVLKAFLDLLPEGALAGKSVLPMATAGSSAHLLAVDYALRPVLAALGAKYVPQSVYATNAQFSRRADGGFDLSQDIAGRLDEAVGRLIQDARLVNHTPVLIPVPRQAPDATASSSSQARCRA